MALLLPAPHLSEGFHGFLQALGASSAQSHHVLQVSSAFDLSGFFEFFGKGDVLLVMIFAMMNPVFEPNSGLVDEFHFASSISRADVLYHIREETSSVTPPPK